MRMTIEEEFDYFVEDYLDSLQLLFDNKKIIPYLTVYYSFIDVFAFTIYGENLSVCDRYKRFIEDYMAAYLPQNITSSDLYGARCKILPLSRPKLRGFKEGIFSGGTNFSPE